ncbi:MAG: sigma 54-interacting transcriptional regulator [Cocleimonas sp.]
MAIEEKETARDSLTEVKITDELLLTRHQHELILEAAGEGIYVLDQFGMTTYMNPTAAQLLGWSLEELIGKPNHSMVHHTKTDGSHYPKQECPIYAAFKDGAVHHVDDEVFWRKDGSSFPVDYTSTPIIEDKQLVGAVVVFKDITERREAEQALEKAHAEVESMKERLEYENVYLQEEIRSQHNFKEIIGQSKNILNTLKQIEMVAPTYASVLVTGESGTGKELLARAIHERSDRSDRPMIRVNCAAIPQELFESEFFGHVKGAFTGALKDRAGRFELADGGTIFLDEVGEIPLELQSKLLRVLQEGECQRVGEERPRQIDVRVIAATNKDLKAASETQEFREDLYYRLNVFPLEVAPLRDRKEDIPLLASYFIELISGKLNRPQPKLTQGNIQQLQAYDWPGNIRELQNLIERAIILSMDGSLQFQLPGGNQASNSDLFIAPASGTSDNETNYYTEAERHNRDRDNILAALNHADWKISGTGGAAELLEIKPTTLASRMKTHGIAKR